MLILPNNERKTAAATKNVSVTQQCHECFNNRRIIKLSYQKLKNFNIALGDFLSFLKKCVADKCLLESENSRLKQEISDIKAKYENDLFNMREALNETHNKLNFFEANTKSLQDRNKDDETRCLLESENSQLKQEVSNIKAKYENDLSNMREALNETHNKLSFFETYTKSLQDKYKDLEARLQRKSSNLQKQCIFTYNSKILESVSSLQSNIHCLESKIHRLKEIWIRQNRNYQDKV
ncbi:uncharacterized protein LOC105195128 [Solenopsis invicta]|uniref:uncharacterized protein LOC105195128 n=1 Tax=Solenopsis invicta TaxID=13686 RepID=UPI00193CBE07|nr:uncharacterized protein LOC105195128 [Solenopsis invicta]